MASGSPEHRYQLARCIEQNATSICRSVAGCKVVEAAIEHAAPEDMVWIARAVAQNPEVIFRLSKRSWGRHCALRVLEALPAEECHRFGLAQHLAKLRSAR